MTTQKTYNNLQQLTNNKQRMSHYAEDGTLKFETPQQEILFLKQQLASSHMIRDEQEKTIEKYRKVQEENERLYDENEQLKERIEKLRTKHLSREDELAKIVCPHSKTQSYKDIKEGCLKLSLENEKLKEQLNQQRDYVDTMEYETKIEQLESFNGGQEFWNDAEDVLEVLQNDGLDEEEIKRIIEDKCSGYTYDIEKEELVKVE